MILICNKGSESTICISKGKIFEQNASKLHYQKSQANLEDYWVYSRLSFWLLMQILFTAEIAEMEPNLTFVLIKKHSK